MNTIKTDIVPESIEMPETPQKGKVLIIVDEAQAGTNLDISKVIAATATPIVAIPQKGKASISADTVEVPTVTVTATMPATGPAIAAQFATTPKRKKARKMPKEPSLLYAYAVEQGGHVNLTDAVKQELVSRGLPAHRIPNAAYGIRKFFGKTVTPTRTGRTVTAYTISL